MGLAGDEAEKAVDPFCLDPEQPAGPHTGTEDNAYFDIPQPVSSVYTGREALHEEVKTLLLPNPGDTNRRFQRRLVLHGLPGSGKTQFCCKFAQDNRERFWGVFWLDASSDKRAKQSLVNIARMTGVEADATTALEWLSTCNRKWLLIIDDADFDTTPLEAYFPRGDRGTILITTRNPDYSMHGNIGPRHFSFGGLPTVEAEELLLKASDSPMPWDAASLENARRISQSLGLLPLAIVHAGAVIGNGICDMPNYLDFYQRTLLRLDRGAKRDSLTRVERAVFTTFELCVERLEQKATEAAMDALDVLNILAFLHFESASLEMFRRAVRNPALEAEEKNNSDSQSPKQNAWSTALSFVLSNRRPAVLPSFMRNRQSGEMADEYEAYDRMRLAFRELQRLSLVIYNDDTNAFSMHPIVHTWVRVRPAMRLADQALWVDIAGRLIAASILLPPLGMSEVDERFHTSLLPHIEHNMVCRESIASAMSDARGARRNWLSSGPDEEIIRMYTKFSLVYIKCGRWRSAEKLLTQVHSFLRSRLGLEDWKTRNVALLLAKVYRQSGRMADTAALQNEILKTCIASLGLSHPATPRAMSELGMTYYQQGLYSRAWSLQEDALRLFRRIYGDVHEDVCEAQDRLGLTARGSGDTKHLEKAARLHTEAIRSLVRTHGESHDRTLNAKENFCLAAVLLGNLNQDAKDYLHDIMMEVLETRSAKHGTNSRLNSLTMLKTAMVLSASGMSNEAESLARHALPIIDRSFGHDHPGALFGRHLLACILARQGSYDEAKEMLVDLTGMKCHPGPPDAAIYILVDLAHCWFKLGETDRSVALCNSAIAKFDSLDMTTHHMVPKLQAILSRLMVSREYDTTDRSDLDPNGSSIQFPSRFFGQEAPHDHDTDDSPSSALIRSRLYRLYPDIRFDNFRGEAARPGSGDNTQSTRRNSDQSPGSAPRYAESSFSGADSASTMLTDPRYAESVFSAVLTELSATSNSSTDYIVAARDEVAGLLIADDDIRTLVTTARNDPKIGAQRLARNLRRLLIEFSKDLLAQASSAVHKETARLIRTQSLQIANIVNADVYQPDPSLNHSTSFFHIKEETRNDPDPLRQKMQSFLASLPPSSTVKQGFFTAPIAPQPVDRHGFGQDGDGGDSDQDFSDDELDMNDPYDVKAITTTLEQVKEFLCSSVAMVNLKARLRSFVTPGVEKTDNDSRSKLSGLDARLAPDQEAKVFAQRMETIKLEYENWGIQKDEIGWEQSSPKTDFPLDGLDQGTGYTVSRTTVFPRSLPLLLDSAFEQLPFFHSEPPIPKGQVRVRWKCTCGTRLFDDFVELEPGSLEELQDWLQRPSQDEESGEADPTTLNLTAGQSLKQTLVRFRETLATIWKPRSDALPVGESTATAPPSIPLEPSNPLLRLLFCIHQGETGLKLHQERLTGIDSDRQILLFLRAEYDKRRKLTSWLTLRSVMGLSLSRFMVDSSDFADVHHHTHVCASGECVCLPPVDRIGTEYACRPAPEAAPRYVPPIGPRYLTHHFLHPDCVRPAQRFIYHQLPKRANGQLLASDEGNEFGWGVYFEEGWHWRSVYFLVVVLFATGSCVFGITWSVTRGDIQGGFAVSSVWMTLGSLLLGFAAVRSF